MIVVDPYKKHLGGCILGQPNSFGDIDTWAPQIWDNIIARYDIKSVLDIGCGGGYSLKYFLEKGLYGLGIEGLEVAREVSPVKDNIIIHDYTVHAYHPNQDYDFGWCCEFVEHIESQYILNFMMTVKKCKTFAMTHAIPGQGGYHHVNEQNASYWINILQYYNFKYNLDYSEYLKSLLVDTNGDPLQNGKWIRNSLLFFERQSV